MNANKKARVNAFLARFPPNKRPSGNIYMKYLDEKKLTRNNLNKTNQYIRNTMKRNPNLMTINEKKNIYNQHVKPAPIKFVHNIIGKMSKNVSGEVAKKSLINFGLQEAKVKKLVNTTTNVNVRKKLKNVSGFDIYSNRNKIVSLAHAIINSSSGEKVSLRVVLRSLQPLFTRIAEVTGLASPNDKQHFIRLIHNMVYNMYGNLTPNQKFHLGVDSGKHIDALSKTYMGMSSSRKMDDFIRGIRSTGVISRIVVRLIKRRIKHA